MNWKIIAIVFMSLFIVENLCIGYFMYEITEDIELENKCVYDTCYDYPSYYYYDFTGLCECYDGNEVVKAEYLK
jgi:hypothetical protein